MLKRIEVTQARLGMHLHAVDGSWLDNPFWKSRFTISDFEDLAKLQRSSITTIWIDLSKGLDVPAPPSPVQPPKPLAEQPVPTTMSAPDVSSVHRSEIQIAVQVCRRGKAQVDSMFAQARLGRAVDVHACLPLVRDITDSVLRHPGALISLARLKSQDDYTYMHSVAVCGLMVALARAIDLPHDQCLEAGRAGLLHDLGKAAIPLEILNKPGKLTDEEFALVKTHSRHGYDMLAEGGGAGPVVLDVCLHHHERVDGAGYPNRLDQTQLSVFARMGAVCDVYDAVTSDRPYKAGWNPAEAIAQMASWKGHFDDKIFEAFVKVIGIYPIGSLVRLQSNKLAVVVGQNPALTSPVVKLVYSLTSKLPVLPDRVDLSKSSDRIVGREDPVKWGFKGIDDLWAHDQ